MLPLKALTGALVTKTPAGRLPRRTNLPLKSRRSQRQLGHAAYWNPSLRRPKDGCGDLLPIAARDKNDRGLLMC